jgi:hypothetical protein
VSFVLNAREKVDTLLDGDLQKRITDGIPGLSNGPKETNVVQDAYIMAAHMVRCACALQISSGQVETQMILYLEQIVSSLVR